MHGNQLKRHWTSLRVGIWFLALIVVIALVILVATDVIGAWGLLVGSGIAMVVSLLGYRLETEQKKETADDREK